MNDVQQPGARLQYADWKRWPKTYREPTDDEWLRDYDSLTADLAAAQARVAQLEGALEQIGNDVVIHQKFTRADQAIMRARHSRGAPCDQTFGARKRQAMNDRYRSHSAMLGILDGRCRTDIAPFANGSFIAMIRAALAEARVEHDD